MELDDHEDKVLIFAFRLEQLAHPSEITPITEALIPMTEDDEVAPSAVVVPSKGLSR